MIPGTSRGTDARTVTDILTGKQLLALCLFKSAIRNPQSTIYPMLHALCSLLHLDLLPALPVDQMEIAAIDENAGTLSQNKYRITPVYGITE